MMKPETKVGLLFVFSVLLVIVFAFVIGALNPFSNTYDLFVAYNYAGGIEVGSPVRVMGIKVGKVEEIKFEPFLRDESGEEVKLRLKISVDKQVWQTVRRDSEFYINLAGIIGEKFLEISPGTMGQSELTPGATVRGIDPPRVDQLISQSYGLAGQIIELIRKNEGSVTKTLTLLNTLVVNLNRTLGMIDRTAKDPDMVRIVKNLADLTDDARVLSRKLGGVETEKAVQIINRLLLRLDEVDKQAIKKFLQDEGVKARIF